MADIERLQQFIEEAVGQGIKDRKKILASLQECRQMNVEVLPLDINASEAVCTIEDPHTLRLGLSVVAPGQKPFVDDLLAKRQQGGEFQSFQDFCERIDLQSVPEEFLARCIQAGAFDRLEASRARLWQGRKKILQAIQRANAEQASNQISLFAMLPATQSSGLAPIPLPDAAAWTEEETITHEEAAMGFSFTEYLASDVDDDEVEPDTPAFSEPAKAAQPEENTTSASAPLETDSHAVQKRTSGADTQQHEDTSAEAVQTPSPPDEGPPLPPVELTEEEFEVSYPHSSSGEYVSHTEKPSHVAETTDEPAQKEVPSASLQVDVTPDPEAATSLQHTSELTREPPSIPDTCIVSLAHSETTELHLLDLRNVVEKYPGTCSVMLEFITPGKDPTRIQTHKDYAITPSEECRQAIQAVLPGEQDIRFESQ